MPERASLDEVRAALGELQRVCTSGAAAVGVLRVAAEKVRRPR